MFTVHKYVLNSRLKQKSRVCMCKSKTAMLHEIRNIYEADFVRIDYSLYYTTKLKH